MEPLNSRRPPAGVAARHSRADWLAAVLWRHPRLLARLLALQARSRRVARRAALGVGLAALIVALSGSPASAATIEVADGAVGVAADGRCSLIEAIANANDATTGRPHADCAAGDPAGSDVVTLPSDGYFLLKAADNWRYGANGLPVITSEVTIAGNGATIKRLPTGNWFRILAVGRHGSLDVREATLSHGRVYPDPAREAEVAYAQMGGGILNKGTLRLDNAVISNNRASVGGGLYNAGEVTINGGRFSGNLAFNGGEGLFSFGTADISGAVFGENGNKSYLGTLVNYGDMTITGCAFAGNHSRLEVSNRGELSIEESSFVDGDGGGISNFGDLQVTGSLLSGLKVGFINDGTAAVSQSLITGNGAGILNEGGGLRLINSTLSGNGPNGGVSVNGGYVSSLFSTITNNTGPVGGGVFVSGFAFTMMGYECFYGSFSAANSIISGNHSEFGPEALAQWYSFRCHGGLYLNNTIIGYGGEHGIYAHELPAGMIVPAEPLAAILEPLAHHGGRTATHSLPPGSPAIDALPDKACAVAGVDSLDQRDYARNADGDGQPSPAECDIGAFEAPYRGYRAFAPAALGGAGDSGRGGLNDEAQNDPTYNMDDRPAHRLLRSRAGRGISGLRPRPEVVCRVELVGDGRYAGRSRRPYRHAAGRWPRAGGWRPRRRGAAEFGRML